MIRLLIVFFGICYLGSAEVIAQTTSSRALSGTQRSDVEAKAHHSLQQATELIDHNQLDVALHLIGEVLEAATDLHSEKLYVKARMKQAIILNRKSKYEEADQIWQELLLKPIPEEDRIEIYLDKASVLNRRGLLDKGLEYAEKARSLIGSDTTSILMGRYYMQCASLEVNKNEYLPALEHLLQAKAIIPLDHRLYYGINHNISLIYENIQAYQEGLAISKENLEIARQRDYYRGELFAYFGIIHLYRQMDSIEQSKAACFAAIRLMEERQVSESGGYVYMVLGDLYTKGNQLDSAFYYLEKGLEISEHQQEKREMAQCQFALARAYFEKGNYTGAIELAEQALQYPTANRPEMIGAFLGRAYAKMGDFQKAYALMDSAATSKEEKKPLYETISRLLSHQIATEKEKEELIFNTRLEQQRNKVIQLAMIVVFVVLLFFFFLQSRNNRQLRKLNTLLEERNATLANFAYITSHDLKEPIRTVSSFSNLLEKKLESDGDRDEQKEFLGFIRKAAVTLYQIVESLGVFLDVNMGKVRRAQVDLKETFTVLEEKLAPYLQEHRAALTFQLPADRQKITFSRPMLELILEKLIQNGITHNKGPEPRVHVEVFSQKERTLFKVTDNGEGIDPKYFQKIFQPFQTLSNKSIVPSAGMGLSICKAILDNYDGNIWVESGVEKGSSFYFLI
ncbi:MAG: ATP-binding protein [Saprospiraceae bacterium]|nr:hypothetical protein [Lewinella sp.]